MTAPASQAISSGELPIIEVCPSARWAAPGFLGNDSPPFSLALALMAPSELASTPRELHP